MILAMQTHRFDSAYFSIHSACTRLSATSRCALHILLTTLFAVCVLPAAAQTAHLVNGVTIVPDGLSGYVTVDANGNVYSTDATGSVLRQNIRNSVYSETTVATGFSDPRGIAVDNSGNVYVADFANNRLAKVPFNGTTYGTPVSIGTGIVNPRGIAVDTSGNVYASVSANQVVKETLSGGTYTQSTIGTGFSATYGVAVDSVGNVYVTDPAANKVYKETLSGGTYTQSTIGSGLSNCFAVAVDASGNVYLADYSNDRILVETLSGGTYTQSVLLSGIMADSVAVDAYGNVFATDPTDNVLEAIQPNGVDFFQTNIGTTTRTGVLTFGFDTGGTIGSSAVLTNGTASLDFKDLGTGSCATNGTSHTYSAGDTCTMNVTLSPKYAGIRKGAATLTTGASAAPFSTAFLYGAGTGPQIAYDHTTATAVIPTNTAFTGIAVDGSGSVYLADDVNKRVLKETPNGSGGYAQSVVGSALKGPQAIAIDGAGDLYVLDSVDADLVTASGQATMEQFKPQLSGTYVQTTVATGLDFTTGVAVDGSGNVYTTDQPALVKLTALRGNMFSKTTLNNTISDGGIAIDGGGNISIAFADNVAAVYSPGPGGSYTPSYTLGYSLVLNGSIAVDGSGNIYLSGTGQGDEPQVIRVTLTGNGTTTESDTAGAGIIAVGQTGDIYAVGTVVEAGGVILTGVYKLNQSTPPTIPLDSTAVGTIGNPSDPIYFVNIGNAALNFATPTSGTNAAISANFVVDTTFSPGNDCPLLTTSSNPSPLAPGDECRYFVDFAPTVAGTLTGTLTATDNNLNVAGATQVIQLTGTTTGAGGGGGVTLSPTSHDFGGVTLGTKSAAQTFTLTNSETVALSISGVSITGPDAAAFAETSACGASLAAGASCNISVTFAPTTAGSYDATLSVADNAGGSPQTAALSGSGSTAPQAVLNPTSVAFGQITVGTTSAAKTITLSNPGNGSLDVSSIAVTGANASLFKATNNCDDGLNAGASCIITVSYTPSAVESDTAAITVMDNATGSPQSAALTGSGIAVVQADFSIGASPASQSISPGSSASYQITVTPEHGSFSSAIALTAAGLPSGATVTFAPASVTPSGTAVASTMTITVGPAQSAANGGTNPLWPVVPTSFAGVALLPFLRRRLREHGRPGQARSLDPGVAIFMLTLAGGAILGCSGGFAFSSGPTPTSSTVTITGTSGSIVHSTTVTLTVK